MKSVNVTIDKLAELLAETLKNLLYTFSKNW